MGVSAQEPKVEDDAGDAIFDRAKLPMTWAAVGVAGGLAIAGSVERTAGGAIVLGAWVVGIFALHRLGRAGSRPVAVAPASVAPAPVAEPVAEDETNTTDED